jgi:hypothetical protein
VAVEYCELLPTLRGLHDHFSNPPSFDAAGHGTHSTQDDLNRLLVDCTTARDVLTRMGQPSNRDTPHDEAEREGFAAHPSFRALASQKLKDNFWMMLVGSTRLFHDDLPPLATLLAQHRLRSEVLRCVRQGAAHRLPVYARMADVLEAGLGQLSRDCRDGVDSPPCRDATASRAGLIHATVRREVLAKYEERHAIEDYPEPL